MQAILTKNLGPTNTKGSRIKATAQAGSIILSWDDTLNSDENHYSAALQYATRMGWLVRARLVPGCLPDGSYCHVLTKRKD
jgi:hypothetical protein